MLHIPDPYFITFVNLILALCLTVGLSIYKYVYPKKTINVYFLLLIISILPTLSIFREGIYRSGDMRTHLPYLMGFYKNLQEGNIIPLWMGDTCGKYGCPVFELEYILPYYLGSFFHFIGFSFLTSVKLLLAIPFAASAFTMYFWAKEQFGKTPGFVASLLYVFAPYHLIVTHFKGSIGEVLAYAFIPLVFFFTKKLLESNKKRFFFLLAFSFIAVLLSNSSATISSMPFAVGYGIFLWVTKKKHKVMELVYFFGAFLYGLLLASFYWMPALFEVKYTWLRFIDYGGFIPFQQYIYSPTAFGMLYQGHHGEYHQIIGYPHLLAVVIACVFLGAKKIEKKSRLFLICLLLCFLFLLFMFLPFSKPIWDNVSLLHSFIGQTRLLMVVAIITAAIGAVVISKFKNSLVIVLICYFLVATTILNWANRKMVPPPIDPIASDSEVYTEFYKKDTPLYLQRYKTRLPIKDKIISQRPASPLKFIEGNGSFKNIRREQEKHEYVISVEKDAVIQENTYYFPGWTIFANGKAVPIDYENTVSDSFGKITFSLKKGLYKVDVMLLDTPVRKLAKNVTLFMLVLTMMYFIFLRFKKFF